MAGRKNQSIAFDKEIMLAWIHQMVSFGARRAGSLAGKKNEDYLIAELKKMGIENVIAEPIPITCRESTFASVEIYDKDKFVNINAQYIPFSAYTPKQGIMAPLVYADPKKIFHFNDWKGKIVVTDIEFPMLDVKLLRKFSFGVYDPDNSTKEIKHPATWIRLNWHLYKKAFEKGALGFIGILKDQPGGSHRMYAPYGFKEKNILDKPLPGFWVSKHDGSWLREKAKAGMIKAKITHLGIEKPEKTQNIYAQIPGQSDEIIIIHCHHDSPFKSPVEDASGCAVVLSLAKYFNAVKNNKRKILILFTAGHFYGSIGTREFIKKHKNDILPNVALEISVEHIAKEAIENEKGKLVYSGKAEGMGIFVPFNRKMIDLVLTSVQANELDRVFLLPPEGPLGDYPPTDGGDWYEAEIPVINFISNPVYLLNEEDDFDWIMEDRLSKVAASIKDIVQKSDEIDKNAIKHTQLKFFKLQMKVIKRLIRMKTTKFGTRPLY
jgi:hypothetical protein